jgi:hypothetical protein
MRSGLTCVWEDRLWVIEGTRTPDIRDHNPALYQLSYDHHGARQ